LIRQHRLKFASCSKPSIKTKTPFLGDINARMGDSKRGMLFYKWYDQNIDTSRLLFNKQWTHIKTIGVSVFNSQEKTGLHFGPLRLTVRLLYNLTARRSQDIYIEVNGHRYYWHDDPLFIFDDTIQHRSVNAEDGFRAVVFVDVLRPSRFTGLQNAIISGLQRRAETDQPALLQELGYAGRRQNRRGS
jgi:aspartyl/asparaginyl beta-hydroxylase (cupin superfamily)